MSTSHQVTLWCDGCQTFDQASMSASQLRLDARKSGWTRLNGKDLCPKCSEARRCTASIPGAVEGSRYRCELSVGHSGRHYAGGGVYFV